MAGHCKGEDVVEGHLRNRHSLQGGGKTPPPPPDAGFRTTGIIEPGSCITSWCAPSVFAFSANALIGRLVELPHLESVLVGGLNVHGSLGVNSWPGAEASAVRHCVAD